MKINRIAGEHTLHTGGVVGSIPTAPTTFSADVRRIVRRTPAPYPRLLGEGRGE